MTSTPIAEGQHHSPSLSHTSLFSSLNLNSSENEGTTGRPDDNSSNGPVSSSTSGMYFAQSMPLPQAPFLHARNFQRNKKYENQMKRIPSMRLSEAAIAAGDESSSLYGSSLMHGTFANETLTRSFQNTRSLKMARSMPNYAYSSFIRKKTTRGYMDNDCFEEVSDTSSGNHQQDQCQLSSSMTAFSMLNGQRVSLNLVLNKEDIDGVKSLDSRTLTALASDFDDNIPMCISDNGDKVSDSDGESDGGGEDEANDFGAAEPFDFEL